jgi:hypothetical protein
MQTTLQTPQSQMPRTPPVPAFLYESQWPASAAQSGRVAVVIVQHAAQTLTAHTQAALSPRFAGFQDSNRKAPLFHEVFSRECSCRVITRGANFQTTLFLLPSR